MLFRSNRQTKFLTHSCDLYLDINYDHKFIDFLEFVEKQGKPIFAFDSTQTEGVSERVFAKESYQEMVEAILEFPY